MGLKLKVWGMDLSPAELLVILICRCSLAAKTTACQAVDEGSIPFTCSHESLTAISQFKLGTVFVSYLQN